MKRKDAEEKEKTEKKIEWGEVKVKDETQKEQESRVYF